MLAHLKIIIIISSEPARALAGQQQLKMLQSLDVSQRHPQTRPKTTPRRKMPVLTPPNEGTLRQKLSPTRQILFSSDRPSAWPLSASARLLSASSNWSSSDFFSSNISWESFISFLQDNQRIHLNFTESSLNIFQFKASSFDAELPKFFHLCYFHIKSSIPHLALILLSLESTYLDWNFEPEPDQRRHSGCRWKLKKFASAPVTNLRYYDYSSELNNSINFVCLKHCPWIFIVHLRVH